MVQVGTLNSLMTASFSDIVPAFRQRFPHVMMRLHADMVASLKDKLLKNELDAHLHARFSGARPAVRQGL